MINSTDIQQQVQAYETTHKRTMYIIIGIVVLLVGILVFRHFYGPSTKVMFADDKGVKSLMDSMRVHDKVIYQLHTQDSIQIANLQDQLDAIPDMINKINKYYDQKRTKLATGTIDTRIQFLSGHLPKSGTTR